MALVNDEFLLCHVLEFEENIIRSNTETDFSYPDIDPSLGVP